MEKIYMVTGATGFLGREVAKQLTAQQKKVIGLRLPGDKAHLLPEVEYIIGDITNPYSLQTYFEQAEGKEAVERAKRKLRLMCRRLRKEDYMP